MSRSKTYTIVTKNQVAKTYKVERKAAAEKLLQAQKMIREANRMIKTVNRDLKKTNVYKDTKAIEKGLGKLLSSSEQTDKSLRTLAKTFKLNVKPEIAKQLTHNVPKKIQEQEKLKVKKSRKRIFRSNQPGDISHLLSSIVDEYSEELETQPGEYLAVVFGSSYGRTIFSSLDKLEDYIDDLRSDQTMRPKQFVRIEKIKASNTKQAIEKIETKNKSFLQERKEAVQESKQKLEKATGRKIKGRSIAKTFDALASQFESEKNRRIAAEKELAKLRKKLEKKRK